MTLESIAEDVLIGIKWTATVAAWAGLPYAADVAGLAGAAATALPAITAAADPVIDEAKILLADIQGKATSGTLTAGDVQAMQAFHDKVTSDAALQAHMKAMGEIR